MNLKEYFERIKRVLMVSSKPDKDEFKQTVKITGIGTAIIGLIGFIVFIISMLLGGL